MAEQAIAEPQEEDDFFDFHSLSLLPSRISVMNSFAVSTDHDDLSSSSSVFSQEEEVAEETTNRFTVEQSADGTTVTPKAYKAPKYRRRLPGKYMVDESGRRWSMKPTVSASTSTSDAGATASTPAPAPASTAQPFPRPKRQNGRSNLQSKCESPLDFWTALMPDAFLRTHLLHRIKEPRLELVASAAKSRPEDKSEPATLPFLKAFIAVLYARTLFGSIGDSTTADQADDDFQSIWDDDCFSPPFFHAILKKDAFNKTLADFVCQKKDKATLVQSDLSAFLGDFNTRSTNLFEPGDSLIIRERIFEDQTKKKISCSWLRDGRCGYFLRATCSPIIDDSPGISHAEVPLYISREIKARSPPGNSNCLRYLLGQEPIVNSGRTVHISGSLASVFMVEELHNKYRLSCVATLSTSSSRKDPLIPFLAKSSSLCSGRPILVMFSPPVGIASIKRNRRDSRSVTAFSSSLFDKEQFNDDQQTGCQKLPQCLIESQKLSNGWNFKDIQLTRSSDDIGDSIDKILLMECLRAALINAYILWSLQHLKLPESHLGQHNFTSFIKLLTVDLAREYVAVLSSSGPLSNTRVAAAKQLIRHADQTAKAGDKSVADSETGAATKPAQSVEHAAKKSRKNKKGGKRN